VVQAWGCLDITPNTGATDLVILELTVWSQDTYTLQILAKNSKKIGRGSNGLKKALFCLIFWEIFPKGGGLSHIQKFLKKGRLKGH
jgi:hypothetical protein